jgi:hypothetical protein
LPVPAITRTDEEEAEVDRLAQAGAEDGIVDGDIPFMITAAMRAQLHGLGYGDEEIAKLTPFQAHVIINDDDAVF